MDIFYVFLSQFYDAFNIFDSFFQSIDFILQVKFFTIQFFFETAFWGSFVYYC